MKFLFLQQNIIEKQTKKYSLFSKMAGSIPGNIGYSCTYKEKKAKLLIGVIFDPPVLAVFSLVYHTQNQPVFNMNQLHFIKASYLLVVDRICNNSVTGWGNGASIKLAVAWAFNVWNCVILANVLRFLQQSTPHLLHRHWNVSNEIGTNVNKQGWLKCKQIVVPEITVCSSTWQLA